MQRQLGSLFDDVLWMLLERGFQLKPAVSLLHDDREPDMKKESIGLVSNQYGSSKARMAC